MPKYVFDANIFVQAKNLYYQFSFCGGFWQWIVDGHNKGLFCSCKKVLTELGRGRDDDDARAWAQSMPADFFLDDTNNPAVMAIYADVMNWAYSSTHYTQGAKDEFAGKDEADAYLIAVAKHHGLSIVSQEQSNAAQKRRIPLPDAAKQFGVNTIFIYDLLAAHATKTFQLHP